MSKMYLKLEEGRSPHKRGKRSHAPMLRRLPTTILILVMVLVLIALVAAVKAPAHAEEWVWRTYCNQSRTHCYDKRVRAYQPRVYSYERRWNDDEDDRHDRRHCPHPLLRVVGNQHLTVEGAKKAADEQWAGDVRFRHGEIFMDLNNARTVVYTCSRSSIKEGGVTTLGQTLTRCEISATPCRARASEPLPPPVDRDDR